VKAFWARLNVLPPDADPDQRLREVVLAAYSGGAVVGLSGATLMHFSHLRCRMAVFRSAVGPGPRRAELSVAIARRSREVLEQWSRENPSEGVMGIAAQAPASQEKSPPRESSLGLSLAGFSENGERLMVAWFDHALV
jgi:hypothetical protein